MPAIDPRAYFANVPPLRRTTTTIAQDQQRATANSKQNAQAVKTRTPTAQPSGPAGGAGIPNTTTYYTSGPTNNPFGPPPPGTGIYTGGPVYAPISGGDVIRGLDAAGVNCDSPLLPDWAKAACKGITTVFTKPTTTASEPGTSMQQVPACPAGTVRVGNTCVSPGDAFPGGAPLFTEAGGQAVVGAFGLPAISPTVVGYVSNNRGEASPIRRCPRGMVLGFDEFCYPKAVLPRRSRFRKHKGERKPPMTGADAAALRRIGSLKKRVKELAGDAGLTCSTRGRRK